MKYIIFNSLEDFESKNNEIIQSGVCGNAVKYADASVCKHPTQNKWAMSVLHYTTEFFTGGLTETLTEDWNIHLKK